MRKLLEIKVAILRFMERKNLQHWTRIESLNRFSLVTPVFQPASPADWKVGVTVEKPPADYGPTNNFGMHGLENVGSWDFAGGRLIFFTT